MTIMQVDLSGFAETEKQLGLLGGALDADEILDELQSTLLNRIRTRFLAEQSTDGSKWEPSLAGLKRRAAGGTGTLFKTGTLFRSIQAYRVGDGIRGIGTDVPYGVYHQNGEGQVRREFLGFSADDIQLAENLVLLRMQEALGV